MSRKGYHRAAMNTGHRVSQGSAARAAILWSAVLAILFQALAPAAAMAAEAAGSTHVEFCTAEGLKRVAVDQEGAPLKPFAGLPCLGCLAAAMAALPQPELRVEPAGLVAPLAFGRRFDAGVEPVARGPPRPPGQGPPRQTS